MKFCYVDESGRGSAPVIVLAGVVVDAQRMHVTKDDWDELIRDLNEISGGKVAELKAGHLYRGNDYWREWDAGERTALIEDIIRWMKARHHAVTFGAVVKQKLTEFRKNWEFDPALETASEWTVAALHLVLTIQKRYQREERNKGKTVFVFDHAREADELLNILGSPPSWTDGFYERGKKQRSLDQVIDVPYFADSKRVGLLQVADLFAYLLRLYAELADDMTPEKFDGETKRLEQWIGDLAEVLLPDAARWPKNSKDPCVQFYRELAPPSLLRVAS